MSTKKIIIGVIVIIAIILLITAINKSEEAAVVDNSNPAGEQADRGGVAPLTVAEVETAIVGTWQSASDSNSVEVFAADGTVTSRYDGEDLITGTWELKQDETAAYNPSGVFLETIVGGERFVYAVVEIDNDNMLLNYLNRGNMLPYTKVN